jgi:prepilin-type processing-associated H-X9-DG protein
MVNSRSQTITYQKSSFSLVELLIVFSLIALLVSLVSPSLKSILQHGETSTCAKNLQSLSIGTTLYLEDNNQIVLPASQGIGRGISVGTWTLSLKKSYIDAPPKKEGNSLFCPSEYELPYNKFSNYSIPIYNGCAARNEAKYDQVALNNVSRPQDAILLLDNQFFLHRYDYFRNFQNKSHVLRHGGGQNRLYLDGHVQKGLANLELPQNNYWWIWAIGKGQ